MSPKKPVDSLRHSALKVITKCFRENIKCNNVGELKKYFENVPEKLCEEILYSVLSSPKIGSYYKWLSFSVFHYKISKLDCRNMSQKYQEAFLKVAKDIRHLNLKNSCVTRKCLVSTLCDLKQLKSLVIPTLANDEILEVISTMKDLRLLDISGESWFTLKGLKCLKNKNLEVLKIGTEYSPFFSENDGPEIVAVLLEQLPKLSQIKSYSFTGDGLEIVKTMASTNLTTLTDRNTTLDTAKIIIKLCPKLKDLTLKDFEDDMIFKELEKLENLKFLTVHNVLNDTRKVSCKNLKIQSLELDKCILDLNEINKNKNIEELRLIKTKVIFNERNTLELPNLEVLELIDCDITKNVVLDVLKNSKNLKRVAISNDITLNDTDFKTICKNQNSLKNLQELWLSRARSLSTDTLVTLMNHCDKLILVGTLNGWNVEKVDVHYLRCVIYFTNTQLNLVYFGCF